MDAWLDKVFSEYIKKHGPFQTNNEGLLKEEEFLEIYDTIEALGRFQLKTIRDEHAKLRIDKFNKLFFDKPAS